MKYQLYTDRCGWVSIEREEALRLFRCTRFRGARERGWFRSYIIPEGVLSVAVSL
jgi:hypothetical protein